MLPPHSIVRSSTPITMSYRSSTSTHIVHGVTAVDCQKQVRSWSLFRSLMELLIPSCSCHYEEEEEEEELVVHNRQPYFSKTIIKPATDTIIGTIFGHRHGKLSFCIQSSSRSTAPILLLGLEVPTTLLAREMENGLLRIVLKCNSSCHSKRSPRSSFLLSTPIWTMYCNGKRVGHAIKRKPSKADMDVLRLMQSVYVGVGILDGEIMYLRANFARVTGFCNSVSFHLINPGGSTGQELGIFFLR